MFKFFLLESVELQGFLSRDVCTKISTFISCESILARQWLFQVEEETQGRVGGVRFDRLGWGFGFGVVYGKRQHFLVFFWKTFWDRGVTQVFSWYDFVFQVTLGFFSGQEICG